MGFAVFVTVNAFNLFIHDCTIDIASFSDAEKIMLMDNSIILNETIYTSYKILRYRPVKGRQSDRQYHRLIIQLITKFPVTWNRSAVYKIRIPRFKRNLESLNSRKNQC